MSTNSNTEVPVADNLKQAQYQALSMTVDKAIHVIRKQSLGYATRREWAVILQQFLEYCLMDEDLKDLTDLYRDQPADNLLNFDPLAVIQFADALFDQYPYPDRIHGSHSIKESKEDEEDSKSFASEIPARYSKIAKKLETAFNILIDTRQNQDDRQSAAAEIRALVEHCLQDENLKYITSFFSKRKEPNDLGYDALSIAAFIFTMRADFPAPVRKEPEETETAGTSSASETDV